MHALPSTSYLILDMTGEQAEARISTIPEPHALRRIGALVAERTAPLPSFGGGSMIRDLVATSPTFLTFRQALWTPFLRHQHDGGAFWRCQWHGRCLIVDTAN